MQCSTFARLIGKLLLAIGFAIPAHAAFITVDDSDPAFVTITAGDFEGGFFVNGTLLTAGFGSSASITLPDEGYLIEGSWIDHGAADGTRVDLLFSLPADPAFATSGVEFGATSDGTFATFSGSVGGFVDPSLYFPASVGTFLQDGRTESGGVALLTVSFASEASTVPEPGTILLLGCGAWALRRRTEVPRRT